MKETIYIGDGVYAEVTESEVLLYTDRFMCNGENIRHWMALDDGMIQSLMKQVQQLRRQYETDESHEA